MEVMDFEKTVDPLVKKHSTDFHGSEWIDWDAVYSDLLDEGMESAEASEMLDSYIEKCGYV